jgi:hypothetical protein
MGYCTGNDMPGYATNNREGFGMGLARGHRGGRGSRGRGVRFGNPYSGRAAWEDQLAPTHEEEQRDLRHQAERLRRTLKDVEKRLEELEKE